MPEDKALLTAEEFLNKRNPDRWNGEGERPDNFETRLFFFNYRKNGILNFSLSYEWEPTEEDIHTHAWVCVCRCWHDADGQILRTASSQSIDSKDAIAKLILAVL